MTEIGQCIMKVIVINDILKKRLANIQMQVAIYYWYINKQNDHFFYLHVAQLNHDKTIAPSSI